MMFARQLIELEVQGHRLFGTHHLARGSRTGFLFVNFGYVPRDGHGGLSAIASDKLASLGFPCFRVDLPALGDTEGELPKDSKQWFSMVRAGGFADITRGIVDALVRDHAIDRVVIGGLCAASITTIYTCDRDRDGKVAGVVLLEPEMYTTDTSPEGQERNSLPDGAPAYSRARRAMKKAFSYWSWARVFTGESPYSRFVPIPRPLLLKVLESNMSELPERTNLPLVAAWQNVVRSRRPALVVTAEGKMRELFLDRVNRVAVPGFPTSWIEHVRVPHTNHIFTTGGAISIVCDAIQRWTLRTFAS